MDEELTMQKIKEVMKIININRMPTSKEIRELHNSFPGLENAIAKHGGYPEMANKLNVPLKTPTKKHSEKEIKDNIIRIINILKLNRMPTRSEVLQVEGNNCLHVAITRSYGYFGWAEKLGLESKDSETKMGINFQNICKEQIEKLDYKVSATTMKAPYDLIVNDLVRIDVKSGCAYDMRGSRVHSFGVNKKEPVCDLYIIYALDEDGKDIERTFIIPSIHLKVVSLCIGEYSKYNIFLNRWDYIQKYLDFYKTI